jgi:hypothetical protein
MPGGTRESVYVELSEYAVDGAVVGDVEIHTEGGVPLPVYAAAPGGIDRLEGTPLGSVVRLGPYPFESVVFSGVVRSPDGAEHRVTREVVR